MVKGDPKSEPAGQQKRQRSMVKGEEPKNAAGQQKRQRAMVKGDPKSEPAGQQKRQRGMVKGDPKSEPKNPAGQAKVENKTVADHEYFTEKRNLDNLWHQVFPGVGSGLMVENFVYKHKWNFSNLEASFEEGGELHDKNVFLFGITEPQLILVHGEKKNTTVPAVAAVVSPFPPSDKIVITSLESILDKNFDQIVSMEQMKMAWVPYTSLDKRLSQDETRGNSQIFILSCSEMRDALGHLKIERIEEYEPCLPYFCNPFQEDNESTILDLIYSNGPMPCFQLRIMFDWKVDDIEEFTDKMIEKEVLPEDQKDSFKEFLEEKVRVAKLNNYKAREAREKALEEMSERKAEFQNMKFLKFYPVAMPDSPEASIAKSSFINKYYGKAHKVI